MQTLKVIKKDQLDNFLKHSYLNKKFQGMDTAERQASLQDMQNQVAALKDQYDSDAIPFKALQTAYEALRMAWYAVGQDSNGCREKLESLDFAVQRLAEHLLTPLLEETEPGPIPIQFPDWLKEAA